MSQSEQPAKPQNPWGPQADTGKAPKKVVRLPLLASFDQCRGLALPADANLGPAHGQPAPISRLLHLAFRCQEAQDARRAGPERFKGDAWPSLAIVPLERAGDTPRTAFEAVGASLPPNVGIILVPCWKLARTRKERAMLQSEFLGGGRPFLAA